MTIILVVVLAIMLIMNGVMFYVLRTAAIITRKQIKICFVKELEQYEYFLEGKDDENKQLEEQKEELKKEISDMQGVMVSLKSSPFYAPRPVPRDLYVPMARYIDNDFFDNHKLVREQMKSLDKIEVMERIRRKMPYEGDREIYQSACRILKSLSLETLYELGTVEAKAQLSLLREILEGTDRRLLEDYIKEREEQEFDSLGFVSWLREVRTVHDPCMYMRTGEGQDTWAENEQDVVVQYDDNISEGVKFIHQNRLFDFSIYRLRSRK